MFHRNNNIPKTLPQHIGFILDGNGRWAKKRGMPRNFGHKEGIKAIQRCVDALIKFNIPYASMFAFSTENWKRSKDEVDGIFALVKKFLQENIDKLNEKGVKLNFFGDLSPFSKDLKDIFDEAVSKTKDNQKLHLNICLNYGGRADIVRAVNNLIEKGYKKITEKDISDNLYSNGQPDLDLVIRTSGEQRVSNFMIYQLAYSELYFPKIHWPDFDEKELYKALVEFSKRNRRYGGN